MPNLAGVIVATINILPVNNSNVVLKKAELVTLSPSLNIFSLTPHPFSTDLFLSYACLRFLSVVH
jgi:hypothetical protein